MSEYPLPLKRSEVASCWLRSKIAAQYALRGGGKKSLSHISIRTGELRSRPPLARRAADWMASKATAHLLSYQAEYDKELAPFNRSEDRTAQQLSLQDELRVRMLTRRAFRGDEIAFFNRVVVAPERKLDKRWAELAVSSALGAESVLPSGWGFRESGLTSSKVMAEETVAFCRELLSEDLSGVPDTYLNAVKRLVPLRAGQFAMRPAFSAVLAHGQHLGTVRNLFVADGRANAEAIGAYQYMSMARGEINNGGIRMIQPNNSLHAVENFIVGIGSVHGSNELVPLGLLSLTSDSLQALDMADGLARLPGGILPPSSISATNRVYDLVMSDFAMQRAT